MNADTDFDNQSTNLVRIGFTNQDIKSLGFYYVLSSDKRCCGLPDCFEELASQLIMHDKKLKFMPIKLYAWVKV